MALAALQKYLAAAARGIARTSRAPKYFMIDLKPIFLKKVKTILSGNVPEFDVMVYGSRAGKTAGKHSYLDLVVMSDKPLSAERLEKMEAAFKAAGFPFRVDTVDWASTGKDYRKEIKKTGILIQKSAKK